MFALPTFILAGLGLVVAMDSPNPHLATPPFISEITSSSLLPRTEPMSRRGLTADEMHSNIIRSHPANRIIESFELRDYLAANIGSDHTVYVNDTKRFIDMRTVTADHDVSAAVDKRQATGCFYYENTYAKQADHWYDYWRPATSSPRCFYTGKSDAGGSQTISYSFSLSVAESIGLDWTIIKDVLSASLGLTVTETWTHTDSRTCNVNANSVLQIWVQPEIAWGWFWTKKCSQCGFISTCGSDAPVDEYERGGATAPIENSFQAGCSTGYENVQC